MSEINRKIVSQWLADLILSDVSLRAKIQIFLSRSESQIRLYARKRDAALCDYGLLLFLSVELGREISELVETEIKTAA